jgi:hypothetical protein
MENLKFEAGARLYIWLSPPRCAQQRYDLDSISNSVFNPCFGKIGSKGETLFVLIWFSRSRGVHLNHPKIGSAQIPSAACFAHEVKAGLVRWRRCE